MGETVTIRNVPDDAHDELMSRAGLHGQSLQEYLLSRLVEEASRPTVDEVLQRAGGRAGGSLPLKDAVSAVKTDRARR